ncbi:hypothetical protein ACJMK2_012436 [Sinanodonta woodiana]|uniref:Interleukin 17-like protein n=1 Tax=Sinanodonta woodiana TaxID=1069815 RepID=A0ABD3V9D6_SINWO
MFRQIKISQAVFVYTVLAVKFIYCAPVRDECQPPANLSAAYQRLSQASDRELYFLVPSINSIDSKEVPEKDLTAQCDSKKHGETCPTKVLVDSHIPVYARSNCPWIYAVDHDPLRFPSTILEAKPRCTYCIGSNDDLECNPITRSIRVLRRGNCVEGFYQYVESMQEITLGFTCAGKRILKDKTDDSVDYI